MSCAIASKKVNQNSILSLKFFIRKRGRFRGQYMGGEYKRLLNYFVIDVIGS